MAYLLTYYYLLTTTYLLTHLLTYLLTHSLTHLHRYAWRGLVDYSRFVLTHLLTYLLTYLLTHLLIHSLTYTGTRGGGWSTIAALYSLTYLLTYLLTFSLTHRSLHRYAWRGLVDYSRFAVVVPAGDDGSTVVNRIVRTSPDLPRPPQTSADLPILSTLSVTVRCVFHRWRCSRIPAPSPPYRGA